MVIAQQMQTTVLLKSPRAHAGLTSRLLLVMLQICREAEKLSNKQTLLFLGSYRVQGMGSRNKHLSYLFQNIFGSNSPYNFIFTGLFRLTPVILIRMNFKIH